MSDDVRRLSDELARDPSSLVFLQLGEALRRREQLDLALKIALRGLERHPHNADAHDLLARIAVDRGELERAFDEWDMVLRLDPTHAGARKGMGFVCFRQGRLEDAMRYLDEVVAANPGDESASTALANIRARLQGGGGTVGENGAKGAKGTNGASAGRSADRVAASMRPQVGEASPPPTWGSGTPSETQPSNPNPDSTRSTRINHHASSPRTLFADLIGEDERTALLLDAQGLVLAGAYVSHDGRDVAQEVGAELSGVSEEARRAMRHLGLGDWTSITFETEVATVAMAPAPQEGLLLVAASRDTPLGLVTRFLGSAADRARAWLESLR